jgi:4-alpha-glucanotransferase
MNKRGAGVLLHITSLPTPYGVGDLGPSAYRFADFLAESGQSFWQVLPLNPTGPVYGNSPYSSTSTFAGNTLLISPDLLLDEGLLLKEEIDSKPEFQDDRCKYEGAMAVKERLLQIAFDRFRRENRHSSFYEEFSSTQGEWLKDYARFVSFKRHHNGRPWCEWPLDIRDRSEEAVAGLDGVCAEAIAQEEFNQYLFFKQWQSLKSYCNQRGIQIIGDIPIYVSQDSSDVWTNPGMFKLDTEKRPIFVAGVPPDYFSATGQRWGNPVYDWDALKATGYSWWLERMSHMLQLFDVVRIDHFRGLVAFWEVPAHENNAVNGHWVQAPVYDFFSHMFKRFFDLPIVAEDLGMITADVREAVERLGFPGMKVLLFAFGEDDPMHIYLPHTYGKNFVVYTGTHDNNTVRGWFEREAGDDGRRRLFRYIGKEVTADEVSWEMIRLALRSVADVAIFPLQDVLGLGQEAQMNKPSIAHGNWEWRFRPEHLTPSIRDRLREITWTYGRI